MSDFLRTIATAICKSRTCEGISCCQWPANGGRTECPVKNGGYDEAARDAIEAMRAAMPECSECGVKFITATPGAKLPI